MKYFLYKQHKVYISEFDNDFILLSLNKDDHILHNSLSLYNFGQDIYNQNFNFLDEVIATETEILLKPNTQFKAFDLQKIIKLKEHKNSNKRIIHLPVCFDFTCDWTTIISYTGIEKKTYISNLSKIEFNIAMFGFLPSFIYLNGLPNTMHCPRKSKPSKHVNERSIAVGEDYLGMYNFRSPGGWNVIGKAAFSLSNIPNRPINLLSQEDKLIISPINKKELKILEDSDTNILEYNGIT